MPGWLDRHTGRARDTLPYFPPAYLPYNSPVNSVTSSENRTRLARAQNFADFDHREFCRMMVLSEPLPCIFRQDIIRTILPWRRRIPVFLNTVIGVVLGSTKEKMRRIYAGRVVAAMQDEKMSRYWLNKVFKRKAMGEYIAFGWQTKNAVAGSVFGRTPFPTTIFFLCKMREELAG